MDNNAFEQQCAEYRKLGLRKLVEARLYGDCMPGPIETVIFEKIDKLKNLGANQ